MIQKRPFSISLLSITAYMIAALSATALSTSALSATARSTTALSTSAPTQETRKFDQIDATEIVRQADQKLRGESSYAETSITIVRPDYTRELSMVSWAKGDQYYLILITAPPRDEGSAFLKRGNEIWNWIPTIERTVKLPPSMMSQNWMGTDFTNDDLVKESSVVVDYEHRIMAEEELGDYLCWKIELIPHPDAAVVWGKILLWIDQKNFMQLKAEFYDEDDFLINIMRGSEPKDFGGKLLPSVLEMIPADKEGHKTIMQTKTLNFDLPMNDNFFTVRNMKSVRPRD